ncbi:MAG: DNA polymerase III subunit delta [Eubacteriales bacterium]|nr:DNA polymerase III subunit delta [Eubacteriales bacterium]MDD3199716.1 DNA polymerase III subunit delta [Eubacteriales bacterium]MDD4122228.1 DNA polymerase III subunit delta [Eubacteriales bacterium]MDD4629118.1 DNA polymerase III subunit delta [Eubacteriales bacterium]
MANNSSEKEEHAYKKIDREIKSNIVKNLLFLYGRENFLIHWAVDTLVQKNVNEVCREMDFSHLDGTTVTLEQIINSCETVPFLSPKRVVLISDFKLIEGTKSKNLNEEEEKRLAVYLKQLPQECMLILTAEGVDKRKRLYKTVSEVGSVYEFGELDEKSLRSYIAKRFRESGKKANTSVISQIIQTSGYYDKDTDYNLYNLENDIKKAIAYSEESDVGIDAVNHTISGNIDTYVFNLIDHLSGNRKGEAYQILHNLLVSGENEYRLLALLASHFEIILSVKEMKEEGKSLQEMKKLLGIHEYRIKVAAMLTERYTLSSLRKILRKIYEIDKHIKTGLLEASLALELFIAEI